MDAREKLLNNASARQRPLRAGADRLGVSARTYLERKNSQFRENASVVDVWREALPDEFYELCGLVEPEDWYVDAKFDPCEPRGMLPDSFDWRDEVSYGV